MERLKHYTRTLERFLEDVKEVGEINREELRYFVLNMDEPYTALAEELHAKNLISADTLFTVTRNLDQLKQIIRDKVEATLSTEDFKRVCALVEHKIEILRLNFIHASDRVKRNEGHMA